MTCASCAARITKRLNILDGVDASVKAAPVELWAALPFHRAAWKNVLHGAATMDTLISVGTLAAFGWSVYAQSWGTGRVPGMKMGITFTLERGAGQDKLLT
jgi:P-type Cu+ transporter